MVNAFGSSGTKWILLWVHNGICWERNGKFVYEMAEVQNDQGTKLLASKNI